MVVSMTGFGRSKKESERISVTVELKTVNHRFCEYYIRMPRQLLKIEDKLKKKLGQHILRGRVEVYVTLSGEAVVNRKVHIDWSLLDEYYQYITRIKELYGLEDEISIKELVSREEILSIDEADEENEELEVLVLEAIEDAGLQLKQMRIVEGEILQQDIVQQLVQLKSKVDTLKQFAPKVVSQYKDRLTKRMQEFLSGQVDETRILTEVAIFSDKADINEELTRLESHIKQFNKTLLLTEPVGRKLDFLVQEMNREVNTIGSKANDSTIATEVVEMKSLLEKVKEQVQNIE
jgi:uncharacterized protein (TIGR00255 family)